MHLDIDLCCPPKVIYGIVGPDALVPSLLFSRAVPSNAISNKAFPEQTAHMNAIIDARSEHGKIVKELRIQKATLSKLALATKIKLQARENVLFYKETCGWTGPYNLQSVCWNSLYVSNV